MVIQFSLAQAEDKALALFATGGGAIFAEQYLNNSNDPHLMAAGALLVAIGTFLKAVITTPAPAKTP